MTLEFFMLMIPPTVTHQEKKVSVVEKNGKAIPKVYEPEDLKAARAKLLDNLARYRPERKLEGGVQLAVKWCFPLDKAGKHHDGEYRTKQARYRQSPKTAEGLHDGGRLLEGRCAGL